MGVHLQRKFLAFAGPVVRGYRKTDQLRLEELRSKLNDAIPNTEDLCACATFALNNKAALHWLLTTKGVTKAVLDPKMNHALYTSLDWDAALPIVDPFPPADHRGVQRLRRVQAVRVRMSRRLVLERLLELVEPFGGVSRLITRLLDFHEQQWQWLEMVAVRPQIQRFLERHGLYDKEATA